MRNPVPRIVQLMNAYHSIKNIEIPKQEAESLEKRFRREIKRHFKYTSDSLRAALQAALYSEDFWVELRESLT